MIEFLNNLDTSVFLFFNGLHNDFFDRFMSALTGRFIWIPLYAALLFTIIRAHRPKMAMVYFLGAILAVAIADQTCSTVIRPLVCRLRPSNIDNPLSQFVHIVNGYRGGSYGFPSCHAANSFALAMFMSMFIRRRLFITLIMGWAILNSYTRLYLGVHYPGDLLVGAIIGCGAGAISFLAASRFDHEDSAYIMKRLRQPFFSRPIGIRRLTVIGADSFVITAGDVIIASIIAILFIAGIGIV